MYLFVPAEGWPSIIDQLPRRSTVNDKIGGLSVALKAFGSDALFVREDGKDNDLPFNPVASILFSMTLAVEAHGARPLPVYGDAAVVSVLHLDGGRGFLRSFRSRQAETRRNYAEDLMWALADKPEKLTGATNPGRFTRSAQSLALLARTFQAPTGYPSPEAIAQAYARADIPAGTGYSPFVI